MELQTILKVVSWTFGTLFVVIGIDGLIDAISRLGSGEVNDDVVVMRNISAIIALLGLILVYFGSPISAFLVNLFS